MLPRFKSSHTTYRVHHISLFRIVIVVRMFLFPNSLCLCLMLRSCSLQGRTGAATSSTPTPTPPLTGEVFFISLGSVGFYMSLSCVYLFSGSLMSRVWPSRSWRSEVRGLCGALSWVQTLPALRGQQEAWSSSNSSSSMLVGPQFLFKTLFTHETC